MQSLILTLHIIVCFLLVILILLQSGKEGMGVIFGGGNSSVFGSSGAGGILAKLTTLMAIIFVITSLSYTYVTSSHTENESQILNVQIEETEPPKVVENPAPGEKPADSIKNEEAPVKSEDAKPEENPAKSDDEKSPPETPAAPSAESQN